ncbi:MAG: hypothetical protein GWP08_04560 [Nitrospiraceae bacterium]|nr:hypothetical protein [Nitrospiraceae bacterium]
MVRLRKTALAVVLIVLYAAAVAHQVLPHDFNHGDNEPCALCLLLHHAALTVSLAALCLMPGPGQFRRSGAPSSSVRRGARKLFRIRGPPCPSF